ncbi:MAG: hypothetical protein U0271_27750 [Polyangiaceae bacterium]
MKLEQWVNLAKNKFQETADPSKPLSEARLGRATVLYVKFRNQNPAEVTYRIVPTKALDQVYESDREQAHPAFQLVNGKSKVVTIGGDTYVAQECELPAMGANEYKVEAKLTSGSGEVKTSSTHLTGRRRVYCVPVIMDLHPSVTTTLDQIFPAVWDKLWAPKRELFVDLRKLAPSNSGKIARQVAPRYDATVEAFGQLLRPHVEPLKRCVPGFALVFADQIAQKLEGGHGSSPSSASFQYGVGGRSGIQLFDALNEEIVLTSGDHLWHGFSPMEDLEKHWLEYVQLVAVDTNGVKQNPIEVPRDAVVIDDPPEFAHGGHKRVRVMLRSVPGVLHQILETGGKFDVEWQFRTVGSNSWAGGVCPKTHNYLVVATRVRWAPVDPSDIIDTLFHEIGHRLGLVPDGTWPKHLDKSPRETAGGHCSQKDCIMNEDGCAKGELCPVCRDALQRSDLSLWSRIYGSNIA